MSMVLAKIRPPYSSRLLSRPRLLSSLKNSPQRVILLSAGSGFGKTSLLTDFAAESGMALAWYSLDENDRDLSVFCRYLLQSIRQTHPGFGQTFVQILEQNIQGLTRKPEIHRLAEEFIADLERLPHSGQDTLIVLDDYQFAECFAINRFVERVAWYLPPGFKLVISSRTIPGDMLLGQLFAKQMLKAIGAKDLQFTEQEVNQLLQDLYGIDDPELGKVLFSYSEGWITAVVLALTSRDIGRIGNWHKYSKSISEGFYSEQLFNYIALEIFEEQPAELQDFLLKTCILDLLTPEKCDALLKQWDSTEKGGGSEEYEENSESILLHLEARNLFLTRKLEEEGATFQYHGLFRGFLQRRLKRDTGFWNEVHIKAARVQELSGNYPEAVRHFVQAGKYPEAASLLNQVAEELYEAGRTSTLQDMLESIPEKERYNFSHLLRLQAQLLLDKGDNLSSLETFARAEALYKREGNVPWAAFCASQQAQILARTGKSREALSISTRLLHEFALLMQSEEGQRAIASAKLVNGTIEMESGHYAIAEKHLREAGEIYKALKDNLRLAVIESVSGNLYQSIGRLVKSDLYFGRALAYFSRIGNTTREAYVRTGLANNHYLQARYREAEEELGQTLPLAEQLKDSYLKIFLLSSFGNVYRDTGRYSKAETSYQEALQLARNGQMRHMELLLLNEQATAYILEGKNGAASSLIELSLELAEEYDLPQRAGYSYRNLCWLDLGNYNYKRASGSIEKALNLFSAASFRLEETRSKLTLARLYLVMNEPRKAIATLTECLEQSEELGYEPFLSFEREWSVPLFEFAARKKVNRTVENFLRKHGYIAGLSDQKQAGTEGEDALPEPIPLAEHLNRRAIKTNSKDLEEERTEPGKPLLRVYALDNGKIVRGKNEIKDWRNNRSRELLFFLLEHSSCTRDEILEALWDEETLENAPQAFHNVLYLLRKAIAPVEIKLSAARYYLDGEVWYDANEFSSVMKNELLKKEPDIEALNHALGLYKKDYLSQFYSNWCTEKQRQLLELYLRGLEKLARYYQDRGDYIRAIQAWQQFLLKDTYNEDAYRACIECYLAVGNRVEARRQGFQCLKALEELELKPSLETALLLQKLA